MKVDQDLCIGCEACIPYCPARAIYMNDDYKAFVDLDLCYECGVCEMVKVCPVDALSFGQLPEERLTRYYFNNVLVKHPVTNMTGRGTAEMKTNEVTDRYKADEAGFGIEIGRPDVGAAFRDVQAVTPALAEAGVVFEAGAPTTLLMADTDKGLFDEKVLDDPIICSIIEFTIKTSELERILGVLKDVAGKIDTVFSIDLISRPEADGSIRNLEIAKAAGVEVRPNAKTTIGIGKVLN